MSVGMTAHAPSASAAASGARSTRGSARSRRSGTQPGYPMRRAGIAAAASPSGTRGECHLAAPRCAGDAAHGLCAPACGRGRRMPGVRQALGDREARPCSPRITRAYVEVRLAQAHLEHGSRSARPSSSLISAIQRSAPAAWPAASNESTTSRTKNVPRASSTPGSMKGVPDRPGSQSSLGGVLEIRADPTQLVVVPAQRVQRGQAGSCADTTRSTPRRSRAIPTSTYPSPARRSATHGAWPSPTSMIRCPPGSRWARASVARRSRTARPPPSA